MTNGEDGVNLGGRKDRGKELAVALRLLRESRGLMQDEVAQRAGVSRTMLSGYERARATPTLDVLQALLRAMNADLSILQQFMDLSRSFQGGDISSYVLSPTSAEQEEMAFRRMETALQRWLGTLRSRVLTDVRERRRAG